MHSPHQRQETVIVVGLGVRRVAVRVCVLVTAGFDVIGVHLSTERIVSVLDANSYVEDISDGEPKEAMISGRFTVTTELEALRHGSTSR